MNAATQPDLSKANYDPADLINARNKLEDTLAAERKVWEAREKALKEKIDTCDRALANHLVNIAKTDSARIAGKTVYFENVRKFRVRDWHAYHGFVAEQGQLTLLQKRVSEKELNTWMGEHEGQLPPGVEIETSRVLRVRTAPTKK